MGKGVDTAEGLQVSKEPLEEDSLSKDGTAKKPHGPAYFLPLPQPRQKLTQGLDPSMPGPQLPCTGLSRSVGVGQVGSMLPLTHRLWLMPLVTCSMVDGVQLGGPWVTFTQSPAHLPPHLVLIHCN